MERKKNASEGIAPMGISPIREALQTDQLESRFECPICLSWLTEPVVTTCGHRFCKSCITAWLQNSGHCPIDNVNLTMKIDIFPDNYTRREIQEQRMSCLFSNRGCTVKMAPLDLDSHLMSCQYNLPEPSSITERGIPCSFHTVGCRETFDSHENLEKHLQDCVQSHMSYLMNAYSELKINTDISDSSMDAKAAEASCLWEPDKNENNEDSPEPGASNVSGLIRSLYERVVILEQRNREQAIALANMAKKQNNEMLLRYCFGNYIWKVDNFKSRLDAMIVDHSKMLYSPGFYVSPNSYRFCIRLNISPQNPQCLALHVHLMQTKNDACLEWPFNGRISIYMVNQYDAELTQRDTMMSNSTLMAFQKPTAEICLRGFGYTEYALVSDVLRNGFVTNDTFIIRVHIKCV